MTPISNKTFIKKVKDITISSTIALALLGNAYVLQSCNNNNSESDYEYEEVEVYTKGVKTYITESPKGVFKITDEQEVPADSSVAIVTYLDGKKETLSPQAVQALIDNEVKTNPQTIGESSNLSNALLFGGMGYLLAKTVSPNYVTYRPDASNNLKQSADNQTNKGMDTSRRRRSGMGIGMLYGVSRMGYYANAGIFNKSNDIHSNIGNSRTTISRPVGGRSGFFHGASRSSHSS